MKSNRKTKNLKANRKVKSSKSLRRSMRLRRKSNRKTHSAKKTRSLRTKKINRKSKSLGRTRRRRYMKGGFIEYSALPCFNSDGMHMDADTGKEISHKRYETDWNSSQQYGKESCVSLGTDGAENDPKAKQFGFDLEGLAYEETGVGKENLQVKLDNLMKELGYKVNDKGQVVQEENPYIQGNGSPAQNYMNDPTYKILYESAQGKPDTSPEYLALEDFIQEQLKVAQSDNQTVAQSDNQTVAQSDNQTANLN